MPTREEVLAQALALPPADQAFLADMLEQKLADEDCSSLAIGEVWSHEINRRIAAYDRGETTSLGFEEALDRVKQALAEHRSRRGSP
jgi:uncharacterized membrane protein